MLKRVLVLDNDPGILEVMEEVLDYEGFNVNTFQATDDILFTVNTYKPDLLIIDYLLNGINGGELCRKIKNTSATAHLPVILFSAYPKLLQPLSYYGCNCFITKPFDLSVLVDKVKELLSVLPKTGINTPVNEY
jgi:DNA-binding response OmpR family regulator